MASNKQLINWNEVKESSGKTENGSKRLRVRRKNSAKVAFR